jgi:hypothetical protein
MIGIRAIVGLLATALVAAAAHAESSAKASESATKSAKSASSTSGKIDIKRDAKEGWAEVERTGREIKPELRACFPRIGAAPFGVHPPAIFDRRDQASRFRSD